MGVEPHQNKEGGVREMEKIPLIESVMTSSVLSVEIDAPVRVAEDIMTDHEVRHLPVTDSGMLVGVLSDRDIAFMANAGATDLLDSLRVRDVCSLDVYSVECDEPLDRVLSEMADRHIGSAIVTDGGRIAGVFTATDACRCFADFLRSR
jgi:CBS domain-containing protein